jgi:hypothetical protein
MGHLCLYRSSIRELGGRAPSLGTLRDMSRKAVEMEYLSLYRGFMRGTWGEGPFTEDFKRYVNKGSGNGAFFYRGCVRGTKGMLARKDLTNMFIWLEPVLGLSFICIQVGGFMAL